MTNSAGMVGGGSGKVLGGVKGRSRAEREADRFRTWTSLVASGMGVVGREELPLAVEGREVEGEETAFAIASIVREREDD